MIVSTLGLDQEYRDLLKKEFPTTKIIHSDHFTDMTEQDMYETEAILSYGQDIKGMVIAKMPNLRWVHVGQSGIDSMEIDPLIERRIHVTNSRGINSVTIAEYVLSMMLNFVRNNYVFYRKQQQKEWDMVTYLDELYEKTVGIFGLGKAGQEVAKRCKAFGMNVLGVDLFPVDSSYVDVVIKPGEKQKIFQESDFIVINMPLTDLTKNMIDKDAFEIMKPNIVVINAGRGGIINETDLISALKNKKIAGVVLDVFETEPLPKDNELWNFDNVIITPHIAGDRQKSYMPKMMKILCDNIRLYPDFEKMINPVNLKNGF